MSKLLFTGGTGFIGSHTAVSFIEAGYEIVILDNLSNSDISVIDRIEKITGKRPRFIEGDLRDKKCLEDIFQSERFDGVIHFAGLKAVGESALYPERYYENNILGSMYLFDVMEAHGVRRIVFSSSATVYAPENPLPWNEEGRLRASNPYGTTKLVIESLLADYARHFPWSVANLRYFNPIGAHPSGLIGEDPQGTPNNLMPYILDVVAGKRSEVIIHGYDYDTPDGTGIRDYIHIMDLAVGHLKAYEYLERSKSSGFDSWNLGTGKGTSVLEMIRLTSELIGYELPYSIGPARPGDLAMFYCDPTKAEKMLGWKARYTVREAIEDGVKHISSNKSKNTLT